MKPNRLKQVFNEGKIPVGHMILEFGSRGQAQILNQADLDFTIIDTEHSSFGISNVADMVAWFKATPIAPIVRIPQIEYHLIARVMDAGALGVMVPNVKTGAQAKAIVDAVKYAPLGNRGVIMGSAHTDYQAVNAAEFMTFSNENTTIICQIESVEGLENLEAIATTPGVDILWVGHFDLTQSMGIPGQFDDQRFLDALQQVVEMANAHRLGAGIQPGNVAQAKSWIDTGFNVISYSADLSVYQSGVTQAVADIRDLAGSA